MSPRSPTVRHVYAAAPGENDASAARIEEGTSVGEDQGLVDKSEDAAISRAGYAKLTAELKSQGNAVLFIYLLVGGLALLIGIGATTDSMRTHDRLDELSNKMDTVSAVHEPIVQLLANGPHCYKSGAAALAAQVRIFDAIDIANMEDRLDYKIDRLDPSSPPYVQSLTGVTEPKVSETKRDDMHDETCFTVTWPEGKTPSWATR